MNDLIVSSVHRLTATDLIPFCESLQLSGYCGRQIMVTYDQDDERDAYLSSCGWELAGGTLPPDVHPAVWRFADYASLLGSLENIRFVLATDCRDVVFQENPSVTLPDMVSSIQWLAAPEAINLEDDDWAVENVSSNFPREWQRLKTRPSYCAGTIAGGLDIMRELFDLIFRLSVTAANHQQNPSDQAAYNLIMNQAITSGRVAVTDLDAGFAATCGTVLHPKFRASLKSIPPIVDGPIVRTSRGRPFTLVHQYDRFTPLKDEIRARYTRPILDEPAKSGEYEGFPQFPKFAPNVLHSVVRGKTVAIVGPAPSVVDRGPEIDSADVVVRMNLGFPTKPEDARHVGERTDILYNCLHPDPGCGGPLPFAELAAAGVLLCSPYPRGLNPFHVDICRFLIANTKHNLPYHFIDLGFYLSLAAATGTRPNTGIAAIMDLAAHEPRELRIYGFTFFKDGHRKTYKAVSDETLAQWHREQFTGNHHQEPQRRIIKDLCRLRENVKPDATLAKILEG